LAIVIAFFLVEKTAVWRFSSLESANGGNQEIKENLEVEQPKTILRLTSNS